MGLPAVPIEVLNGTLWRAKTTEEKQFYFRLPSECGMSDAALVAERIIEREQVDGELELLQAIYWDVWV